MEPFLIDDYSNADIERKVCNMQYPKSSKLEKKITNLQSEVQINWKTLGLLPSYSCLVIVSMLMLIMLTTNQYKSEVDAMVSWSCLIVV